MVLDFVLYSYIKCEVRNEGARESTSCTFIYTTIKHVSQLNRPYFQPYDEALSLEVGYIKSISSYSCSKKLMDITKYGSP